MELKEKLDLIGYEVLQYIEKLNLTRKKNSEEPLFIYADEKYCIATETSDIVKKFIEENFVPKKECTDLLNGAFVMRDAYKEEFEKALKTVKELKAENIKLINDQLKYCSECGLRKETREGHVEPICECGDLLCNTFDEELKKIVTIIEKTAEKFYLINPLVLADKFADAIKEQLTEKSSLPKIERHVCFVKPEDLDHYEVGKK